MTARRLDRIASVQPPHEPRRFRRVVHLHAAELLPDEFGGRIERRHDVETVIFKTDVSHERPAQSACADQHRVRHVVVTQKAIDIRNEVCDLKAQFGLARHRTDDGKIFAHLHRIEIQFLGDRRGRDSPLPRKFFFFEKAKIRRHPADGRPGNVGYVSVVPHFSRSIRTEIDKNLLISFYR